MGVEYFYCPDCCECRHEGSFLRCDTCEEMITGDPVGYVCIDHKKDHQITYKKWKFILCERCTNDYEYMKKDPPDILDSLDYLVELKEKKKKKKENDIKRVIANHEIIKLLDESNDKK